MTEDNQLIKEMKRKKEQIEEMGINPYPYKFENTHSSKKLNEKYKDIENEEKVDVDVSIAGRLMSNRVMGKAAFSHIQDEEGRIQIYFRKDDIGEDQFKLFKKLDIGDIIGIKGSIFRTKKGELSVHAKSLELLSKSIMPLPEKHHGIKDTELKYRKRYLDLIMNQESKEVFKKRSAMIKAIRDFLDKKGFMEVETPLLQTQYGGASAKPFVTHINAWNMEMYLSISPELHLKRLIVGGFEKVFTICKNFRNEGVDHSHNPEFTMIEIYQAYADYNDMMKLIEEAYEYAALQINGSTKVTHIIDGKDVEIDFKAPWPKMTTGEAMKEHLNLDIDNMSVDELKQECDKNKIEYDKDATWGDLVLELFDELIEPKIIQPTHVYDRPKEGTPLCKIHREDDRYNEQCEPIGMGMELGNMYSELNDPIKQKKLFEEQVEKGRGGDEEAHPMDDDYVNALEIGMPPTGGIGWGIDRMAILLTGKESIREVLLFPTMKPEKQSKKEE